MFSRLKGIASQKAARSTQLQLESFHYEPLQKADNFRLVHISLGNDNEDLHCSLEEADWSSIQFYEALSYTWGDPGVSRSIVCNGGRLDVSANLFEALRQIRRPDIPVTFWIDQLCIDQNNLAERSSQVKLMGNIYSKANRVIVWLGPEDADSKTGIALAHKILNVVGAHDHYHLMPDHMQSLDLPPYKDRRWRALGQFLRRPWFTRMWVIQEVVMSSNAIFLCGNEILTITQMIKLVDRLMNLSSYKSFNGSLTSGTNGVWCISTIEKIRKIRDKATLMNSIEILGIGMASKATDPRDKLYAVLGLGQFGIEADYTKTVEEVYTSYAIKYLSKILPTELTRQSSKYMTDPIYSTYVAALLVWVHSTDSAHDLPSWVPDWSHFPITTFIGAIPLRQPSAVKIPPAPGQVDKYRSIEISIISNRYLRLSGKLCDEVSIIGTKHIDLRKEMKPHILYEEFADWYAETGVIVSHTSPVYPTGTTWQEAYRRTLAMDNIGLAKAECRPTSTHLEWSHGALRQWNRASSISKFLAGGEENEAVFWHDALKICGRCFFLTQNGYMGLAPYGAREGDIIAMLLGIKIPFVLRKVEEGYRLIGTCYVQGIMEGEVVLSETVPFQAVTLV